MSKHAFGWIRDLPDHRDLNYSAVRGVAGVLPAKVDLRGQFPAVYDQGQLGSCTANAIAGAIAFEEIKSAQKRLWTPSRLFIYYNERVLEGTVNSDSGAQIRDGVKVVVTEGVCPEDEWPYDIAKFAIKPPDTAYQDAMKGRISSYLRISQGLTAFKACLAEGFPFIFGFSVFSSMETDQVAKTGIVPMPQPQDAMVGGHAVDAVGYDDSRQAFIFRNSWGASWGDNGYGYIPYSYLVDPGLAADFWTLRSAPGDSAQLT